MIRLGDIQFLNSWPVTYALRTGIVKSDIQVISAAPAELNRRLLVGELDASAVSSMLYLRHQEELVPIPGLCIRSDGSVKSVLLVSRHPWGELRGKKIAVSNQGATTPILLRLLLRQRRLNLTLESTLLRYPEILKEYPAALLIGDEALLASQEVQEKGLVTWDLGEAWTQWTKLPAVFALWVIRRHLLQSKPECLEEVASLLYSSYEWSRFHPKELLSAMRKTAPFEATFLIRYLGALSYDLDAKAWAGLRRFAKEAEKIGELPAGTARKLAKASEGKIVTDHRPV